MDILLLIYKDLPQYHAELIADIAFNFENEDEAIETAYRYHAEGKSFRMYDVTDSEHHIRMMSSRGLIKSETSYAS